MEPRSLARELTTEIEKLMACVHCGLCLSHCPTYVHLGDENDSPRGRLYLMRAVAEGRLGPQAEAFTRHIDLCLGCRACETACPSGVRYGHLLETARGEITQTKPQEKSLTERMMWFVLTHIFTSPRRLRFVFGFARFLRWSGLNNLLIESGLLRQFPARIQKALAMLAATKPVSLTPLSASSATSAVNLKKQPESPPRTAIFAGCVMRELFSHTNEATKRVLTENGCEVSDPKNQRCCGALHAHAGDLETARQLARANVVAFEKSDCDVIIVNAAGCGAMLKEYAELLADDEEYSARAKAFSVRVKDICEYLAERGFQPGHKALPVRVTYDAPCHLHHAQRVMKAPVELIRRLPGVEFVPLPEAEMCCGSAGIYNLIHPDLADDILARKLELIRSTGAEIVLTGNAGCLMHIGSGAHLAGLAIQVMHPVELMALSY
jgi:glycolate oxidase iron-sulfur subunit